MKISYDPQIDALHIRLIEGKHECRTVRLKQVIALNIGPDEKLLGIEILYATEVLRGFVMATRQIVIDVPEKVLLAEKTDEIGFSRELRILAAVKLYGLGRLCEWCASLPAKIGTPMKARLQRLYEFLDTGLLKVRVLPDEAFGLVPGKAGVITQTDGSRFGHHHRP